jgi:DNA-3-methyladenine glycosylase II
MSTTTNPFQKAQRHLARRDEKLKAVIRQVGACTLTLQPDPFAVLVRSIISQQISTKAAAAIHGRLKQALGGDVFTPADLRAISDDVLKSCGLSTSKRRYLRDLADKVHEGTTPLHDLETLTDEAIVARLVQICGIGTWTAQMLLIFCLGRLDVLPVDDLGLRNAIQRHYGLKELPKKAALIELAAPWQPYRSVASWYLWRSLGGVGQSATKVE